MNEHKRQKKLDKKKRSAKARKNGGGLLYKAARKESEKSCKTKARAIRPINAKLC